jgi:uncharacterized DUF497 family protein
LTCTVFGTYDDSAVRIDFDPDKDRANLAKHGVSLAEAELLDWNELTATVDDSQDFGEER